VRNRASLHEASGGLRTPCAIRSWRRRVDEGEGMQQGVKRGEQRKRQSITGWCNFKRILRAASNTSAPYDTIRDVDSAISQDKLKQRDLQTISSVLLWLFCRCLALTCRFLAKPHVGTDCHNKSGGSAQVHAHMLAQEPKRRNIMGNITAAEWLGKAGMLAQNCHAIAACLRRGNPGHTSSPQRLCSVGRHGATAADNIVHVQLLGTRAPLWAPSALSSNTCSTPRRQASKESTAASPCTCRTACGCTRRSR